MNRAYKKVSALVFSVMVTTSAFGMEVENIAEQNSSAWYKKGSVYAAATAVTLAVVGCAYVVRTGKVAVPTLVAGLFAAKIAHDSAPQSDIVNNNAPKQAVVTEQNQNQDQGVVETSKGVEQSNSFNDVIATILENLTPEDLRRINEELVR